MPLGRCSCLARLGRPEESAEIRRPEGVIMDKELKTFVGITAAGLGLFFILIAARWWTFHGAMQGVWFLHFL